MTQLSMKGKNAEGQLLYVPMNKIPSYNSLPMLSSDREVIDRNPHERKHFLHNTQLPLKLVCELKFENRMAKRVR